MTSRSRTASAASAALARLGPREDASAFVRYAMGVVFVAGATVLTALLWPWLRPSFSLLLLAVVMSALYGGLGPAATASVLTTLVAELLLGSSHHDGHLAVRCLIRLAALIACSFLVTRVNESQRRAAQLAAREAIDGQARLRDLSARLVMVQRHEHRRIAGELHDEIGQTLAAASIRAGSADRESVQSMNSALDATREMVDAALAQTRTLAGALAPPRLADLPIGASLAALSGRLELLHRIRVEFAEDGAPKPLSDEGRHFLYQATREALLNVAKHAQTNAARVSLERVDGHVRVEVADGGRGFDPGGLPSVPGPSGGFGLLGMSSWAESLGGRAEIESSPGNGTRVVVTIPAMPEAR